MDPDPVRLCALIVHLWSARLWSQHFVQERSMGHWGWIVGILCVAALEVDRRDRDLAAT